MIISTGINDDYAVVSDSNNYFYYGYEFTEDGDWCFVHCVKSKIVLQVTTAELIVLNPKLKKSSQLEEFLLTGIFHTIYKDNK